MIFYAWLFHLVYIFKVLSHCSRCHYFILCNCQIIYHVWIYHLLFFCSSADRHLGSANVFSFSVDCLFWSNFCFSLKVIQFKRYNILFSWTCSKGKPLMLHLLKIIIDSSQAWKEIRMYKLRNWRVILQGQLFYYSGFQTVSLHFVLSYWCFFFQLLKSCICILWNTPVIAYYWVYHLPKESATLNYLSQWQITCYTFLFCYRPFFFKGEIDLNLRWDCISRR